MQDGDRLHRFLFEHSHVRGEYVRLDASWQAVLERHDYPPAVARLLGEAMAATVLLSATIKFQGSIILQVQGEGPMTMLVVQVSSERTLRGMAEYNDAVEELLPLNELFSNGRLVITIDPGQGMDRYQGIVELGDKGISEALEGYFERSEQLGTRLWLAANGDGAAGLLLQELPDDHKKPAEDADTWQRAVHLASTVSEEELLTLPFRELLRRLYHEEDVRVFEPEPVSFRCSCSRERIEETLRGLGQEEVRDILQEQGMVNVDCSFCNHHYEFDSVDVEQIFAPGHQPDVPRTRH